MILQWLQVIYISTDSSPSVISRICHNKPYLRLTPHDDSDFAPLARSESEALARQTEVGEVARDEAFVMAEEVEMRRVVWREGEEEKGERAVPLMIDEERARTTGRSVQNSLC